VNLSAAYRTEGDFDTRLGAALMARLAVSEKVKVSGRFEYLDDQEGAALGLVDEFGAPTDGNAWNATLGASYAVGANAELRAELRYDKVSEDYFAKTDPATTTPSSRTARRPLTWPHRLVLAEREDTMEAKLLIGGELVPGEGPAEDVLDPATGESSPGCPRPRRRRSAPPWPRRRRPSRLVAHGPARPGGLPAQIADAIEASGAALAKLESRNCGKPLAAVLATRSRRRRRPSASSRGPRAA